MKKALAMLSILAMLAISLSALAEVPQLSGRLFDAAKLAVSCLSAGDYDRLAGDLPYAAEGPSAGDWAQLASAFESLGDCQTQYAVAYWRSDCWNVAVPLHAPDSGGVETLVFASRDGSRFDGARREMWAEVQSEYAGSDHITWNQEYLGGAMLFPDSGE